MAQTLLASLLLSSGCEAVKKLVSSDDDPSSEDEPSSHSDTPAHDPARSSAARCGAPDFPCTWVEVPVEVQARTRDLAAKAMAAGLAEGRGDAAAAVLAEEGDVTVLSSDEDAVRFRVQGGRPAWVFVATAQTLTTIGGPLLVPTWPWLGGDGKVPIGDNPTGKIPKKRALILSPFRWQWEVSGSHDETEAIKALLEETPDYAGDDGVTLRESRLVDGRVDFAVGLEDFMGWDRYDVVHVSTHGTSCKKETAACDTALATGEVWSAMGEGHDDADMREFLRAQGIDIGFVPILSESKDAIARLGDGITIKQITAATPKDGRPMSGVYEWMAGPFVLATSEFFAQTYEAKLDDKIIFLSACKSATKSDLVDALAGPNTAVLGWNKSMGLDTASDAAKFFWALTLGRAIGMYAEEQGGRTVEDAFASLQRRSDNHGVLKRGPLKSIVIEGVASEDETTGAKLEPNGATQTRAREIVGLIQPTKEGARALEDGGVVPMRGSPGDGKPDALELVAEVIGVGSDDDPKTYVIHVDVEGKEATKTWRPDEQVAEGVWRGRATVDLGFDLPVGKTFSLEPWVELPGGGTSRWRYEDISTEYFVLTVSGPAFPTPQTFAVDPAQIKLHVGSDGAMMTYLGKRLGDESGLSPQLRAGVEGRRAAASEDGSRVDRFSLGFRATEPGQYPLDDIARMSVGLTSATGSPQGCPESFEGCHPVGLNGRTGTVKVDKVVQGKALFRPQAKGPNAVAGTFEVTLERTDDHHEGQRYEIEGGFSIVDEDGWLGAGK